MRENVCFRKSDLSHVTQVPLLDLHLDLCQVGAARPSRGTGARAPSAQFSGTGFHAEADGGLQNDVGEGSDLI